ncbi:MAG: endonuclease/exonuclease/phosphatase family protein [Rhodospirillaceae bacterium]|nr:endonuclease/exonuclease/phosphatase family protein [Rhodospirillaceae bacterium]
MQRVKKPARLPSVNNPFSMFGRANRFLSFAETESVAHLGSASAADFGETIKLISWNMFKARRKGCMPDLTSMSAGVELVLLQEAVLHGGIAQPFHLASGLEWIMAENIGVGGGVTTGPKTGSRVPSIARRVVKSPDREPLVATPKTFLITSYPFAGQTLLVLNVHAINLVSTAKFARQIEQIIGPVHDHTGPCIVAGDFNTWNESRWHLLQKAMADLGLTRVPAAAPQWRHFNQVLDHVFYRDLKLMNSRALLNVKSSDHVPLWAEFAAIT